jgi:sec-independent protein translocase protein TatA
MSTLGLRELLVLLLIVIILFGAKRLPETARSLGKSLRILKSEAKGTDESKAPGESKATDEGTDSDESASK